MKITHPENDDLAFLYGTILTDGRDDMSTQNLCVFADHQASRNIDNSELHCDARELG